MNKTNLAIVDRLFSVDPLTDAQKEMLLGRGDIYIDAIEAADLLGVSVNCLYRLPIDKIKSNPHRLRYRYKDIIKYIDSHTEAQAE